MAGALAAALVPVTVLFAAAYPMVAAGGLTLLVAGLGARRLARRRAAERERTVEPGTVAQPRTATDGGPTVTEEPTVAATDAADDETVEDDTPGVDPTDHDAAAGRCEAAD